MGKEVFTFIIKEMKDRKYFSSSAYSTPNLSHTYQLTVIVYVFDSGPKERFLKFLPLASHKGKYMADLVLEVLNESNMDVINCRGQSYDNVSNASGTYKGMRAEKKALLVRRLFPIGCTLAKFSCRVSHLLLY